MSPGCGSACIATFNLPSTPRLQHASTDSSESAAQTKAAYTSYSLENPYAKGSTPGKNDGSSSEKREPVTNNGEQKTAPNSGIDLNKEDTFDNQDRTERMKSGGEEQSYDDDWRLRGTITGYSESGQVEIGQGKVRVDAFDTTASPHVLTFSYDVTVVPKDQEGLYASPVYERSAITGAYGAIGSSENFSGAQGATTWVWTFSIKPGPATCGNCGQPGLNILEQVR